MNIIYIYTLLIILLILLIVKIYIFNNSILQKFTLIDKNKNYWDVLNKNEFKEYIKPIKSAWGTVTNKYKSKKPNNDIIIQFKESAFIS